MSTIETTEAPASQPTATCTQCGCTSTLPGLFQKTFRGTVCPACAARRNMRRTRNLYLSFNLIALFDIAYNLIFFNSVQCTGYIFIIVELCSFVSIIMHELFHATAAWLLGGRVFGIHLGMGTPLLRHWRGDFFLGIFAIPMAGFCFAAFPTRNQIRLRYGLYVFAGPFFHIVVILLYWFINKAGFSFRTSAWLNTLFIVSGMMLLTNLFPLTKIQSPMGLIESDGARLWKLVTNRLKPDVIHLAYYLLAANFSMQRSQDTKALQEIEEGYTLYPDDELMRNMYGYMLYRKQRYAECSPIWRKLVEEEPAAAANPLLRALHYNNYDWIMLMHKLEPNYLELAQRYANQAFAMAPWIPYLRGTLAALYLEQGNYPNAIEYALEAARIFQEDPTPASAESRASYLATAALAYYHQGNTQEANRLLSEAKQLAAHEEMVEKANHTITLTES